MDEIVEMFSTYLGLGDSNGRLVIRGISDPELATRIKSLVKSYQFCTLAIFKSSEPLVFLLLWVMILRKWDDPEFFARQFLTHLRHFSRSLLKDIIGLALLNPNDNRNFVTLLLMNALRLCSELLASRHLVAYLQHIGKNSARKVYRRWQNFPQTTRLYTQQDFYQIAWLIASNPARFFSKFKLDSSRSVARYASKKIEWGINDEIFHHLGLGPTMCSDWGLLKQKSRKLLQEALEAQGYSKKQIDCYLLARDCFSEIYVPCTAPGSHSLSEPTAEQFQEMTALYNQLLNPSPAANHPSPAANHENIRAWLQQCIQALRCYQQIDCISSDAPSGHEESSAPVSETIADPASDCPSEQFDVHEPATELMNVLLHFLESIHADRLQLLLLRCGCGLSFRSIAPFFGTIKYSTVNRRYNRVMHALLEQMARWAKDTQGVIPDPDMLEEIFDLLEECLQKYYQGLILWPVLQKALIPIDCQHKRILHLRYFRQMTEADIAHCWELPTSEVNNCLVTSSQQLERAIASWLQNHLEASPDLLISAPQWIANLVQTLLANYLDHNSIH